MAPPSQRATVFLPERTASPLEWHVILDKPRYLGFHAIGDSMVRNDPENHLSSGKILWVVAQ
jgi:hypothetical protein